MCVVAVKQDDIALQDVPNEIRDREMCLTVVSRCRHVMKCIPYKFRDREMCSIAVSQYGLVLEYIPNELRDRKMCIPAVTEPVWHLNTPPPNYEIAKCGDLALEFVHDDLRDREMCFCQTKSRRHCIGIRSRRITKKSDYVGFDYVNELENYEKLETLTSKENWLKFLDSFFGLVEVDFKFPKTRANILVKCLQYLKI